MGNIIISSRRRLSLVIVLAILVSVFAMYPAYGEDSVKVRVNDKLIEFDVEPYIDENNRTMVPVRFISEKLGATVEWLNETKEVVITGDDKVITLKIGEVKVKVNDETITLDTAASIRDGRTFVPVRFISEAIGATVQWDGATRTVIITSGRAIVEEEDITDKEFEEFINSEEGAKYASTDYFRAENGKLIFDSNGHFSKYSDKEVSESHFKEINTLAYNLVKELSYYAKENGGAVRVRYNDLTSNTVIIQYCDTIETANAKLATYNFSISLYERPLNDEFTHICLKIGRLWGKPERKTLGKEYIINKGFRLDKYTTAYNMALDIMYSDDVSKKIYDYTINQYDISLSNPKNTKETLQFGDRKFYNWNEDGHTLTFTTDY